MTQVAKMVFSATQSSRLQLNNKRLQVGGVLQGQQNRRHTCLICASTAEKTISNFVTVQSAIEDLKKGRPIVVLDDESRENEGDLIIPADRVSVETMAFIVEYSSGVICVGMKEDDLERLQIPLMVEDKRNEEAMYTAFTVTVDAWNGITTGISAADRTKTVKLLSNPETQPQDLRKPGHIFPLRSRPGGVLERPGHTEASVDLARLAGSFPAGVICEIVDKRDGSMAHGSYLFNFAEQHNLKCLTVRDLQLYRLKNEKLVEQIYVQRINSTGLQRSFNNNNNENDVYLISVFKSLLDDTEHVAIERIDGPVNGHERHVKVQVNGGSFLHFLEDVQKEEQIDVWIFISRKQQIGFQEQIQSAKVPVDLTELECGYVRNIFQEINTKNFKFVGNITKESKQNVELFIEKQSLSI